MFWDTDPCFDFCALKCWNCCKTRSSHMHAFVHAGMSTPWKVWYFLLSKAKQTSAPSKAVLLRDESARWNVFCEGSTCSHGIRGLLSASLENQRGNNLWLEPPFIFLGLVCPSSGWFLTASVCRLRTLCICFVLCCTGRILSGILSLRSSRKMVSLLSDLNYTEQRHKYTYRRDDPNAFLIIMKHHVLRVVWRLWQELSRP